MLDTLLLSSIARQLMTADEVEVEGMRLAENTRQVLLAGGMEGCCVYCMDKATEGSFSSWMEIAERA